MLDWKIHKADICKRIAETKAPFKILLKTRDENLLLQDWIDHHVPIVGPENIVIFDHNSTDNTVKDIYKKLDDRTLLCKFEGFLDNVHNVKLVAELYESLQASCDHFLFLDTDERLVWADERTIISDKRILDKLQSGGPYSSPGTWLQNITGFKDKFSIRNLHELVDGLRWGKPIVSTDLELQGIILHNVQLAKLGAYRNTTNTNFIVLHLRSLYVQQRILSNMRKLVWHGVVSDDTNIDFIKSINLNLYDGKGKNYVEEIQRLSTLPLKYRPDPAGSITIPTSGELSFANEPQAGLWSEFIGRPKQFVEKAELLVTSP